MPELLGNPSTKNLLAPQGFQLFIKRLPGINYFIQKVPLGGVELGVVMHATPFIEIPIPGEHMRFEEVTMEFKVDEDCENYLQILNWMVGLGKPDSFEDRVPIQRADEQHSPDMGSVSDLSVLVTNGRRNLNIEVVYEDAFPTALSQIEFDATDTEVSYIMASVRFVYRRYYINKL